MLQVVHIRSTQTQQILYRPPSNVQFPLVIFLSNKFRVWGPFNVCNSTSRKAVEWSAVSDDS